MPDLRLVPGQLQPSDVGVSPAERARADIVLRPSTASDVADSAQAREVIAAAGSDARTGGGTLAATSSLVGAGLKGIGGGAQIAATAAESGSGVKVGAGGGSAALAASFAGSGVHAQSGGGTLALVAALAGSGTSSEVHEAVPSYGASFARRRAPLRTAPAKPVPVDRRSGGGYIFLRPRLAGSGAKTFEADDELVLALAA